VIVGLIPARIGSVRIPNKNIREIASKELIKYTIDAASASHLKKIILSTDYKRVQVEHLLNSKVEYIKRPLPLCTSEAAANKYIKHIIDLKDLGKDDVICLLQPTCPLRETKDINNALAKFKQSEKDSLVSVYKLDFLAKLYNAGGINIGLSQDNYYFYRNSSIYIFKVGLFLDTNSIFEKEPVIFEMEKYKSIDIDTEADFVHAELILKALAIKCYN